MGNIITVLGEIREERMLRWKEQRDNMKYLKQFVWIILISFLGEVLHHFLPFPIPASIYGLVLMLLVLGTGILKLEKVKKAGDFLIEIMPVMFIPAAVGLLNSWNELRAILFPVVFITLVTTILVMVVSGRVTQFIIRRRKKEDD